MQPIAFELGAPGSGLIIYVPAGYITDGFSMPGKALQAFQPRSANFLLPSILHDWLYDTGLVPREGGRSRAAAGDAGGRRGRMAVPGGLSRRARRRAWRLR